MLRWFRVLLVGVVLAALPPAAADAQVDAAPPGNSAVDQYRESVPQPDGPRRRLSARDRAQLHRLGPDGDALAATLDRQGGLAATDAAAVADRVGRSSSGDRRADPGRAPASGGQRAGGTGDRGDDERDLAGVSTSAVGSQLPLGWMAVLAVALVAAGLVRRRRA